MIRKTENDRIKKGNGTVSSRIISNNNCTWTCNFLNLIWTALHTTSQRRRVPQPTEDVAVSGRRCALASKPLATSALSVRFQCNSGAEASHAR